ncbi:hypothetical protein LSH36_478g02010 [Paralvinella palmiformis]|uniref:Uncharacterized protein n=1 Tax=Paralvinella palmiformis TaxID=53620 RepID=A0AAD9MYH0_9ANNE|nr:hypothetical protein LSH36_478g02010 [Paralvinella palmiformis]
MGLGSPRAGIARYPLVAVNVAFNPPSGESVTCVEPWSRTQKLSRLNQQQTERFKEQITPESATKVQASPPDHQRDAVLHDNEVEEDVAVEMPPPMEEIKTHTLPPSQPTSEEDRDSSHPSEDGASGDVDRELPSTASDAVASTDGAVETSAEPPKEEQQAPQSEQSEEESFVINELIETERDYVRDLGLVVEGYMQTIQSGKKPIPEDMQGKDRIVFGNIHQIFDWHRETFSKEVEKCADDPERVGGLFIKFENKLHMYVRYCENKPKSEYIVAEYIDYFEELRKELGHKLQLPDLLIKPVQRIMKYQLLLKVCLFLRMVVFIEMHEDKYCKYVCIHALPPPPITHTHTHTHIYTHTHNGYDCLLFPKQDILKYTDRMGDDTKILQKAVQVMCVVPKAANDMMIVGRLQGFEGKITAQGKLLLQDTLMVQEHNPKAAKGDQQKFKERRVFLFEQIIIFSEEIEKKNNLSNPGYIYKNSLMVNKMELDDKSSTDPLIFALIDKTPRSNLHLICQAPSDQVKQNWVSQIRAILEMQKDFLAVRLSLSSSKAFNRIVLFFTSYSQWSSPELGSTHRSSLLRKTHSHPQSDKMAMVSPPCDPGFRLSDPQKYTRCKSVPTPLPKVDVDPSNKTKKNAIALMLSSALLPTKVGELPPGGNPKTSQKNTTSSSPKPKRNFLEGVKNTLRPRKSPDNSSTSSSHGIIRASPAPKDSDLVQIAAETELTKNADTYAMILSSGDRAGNSGLNSLLEMASVQPDDTPTDDTS